MNDWITLLAAIAFWSGLFLLAHSYVGYPLLLSLLARGRSLPAVDPGPESKLPEVAVLLSAYNEESVIEETLESILASDYPADKLTVWIGSDGSTDRTHEILGRFARIFPQLEVSVFGGRNGKIRIVNRLAEKALARFADPASAVFVLCDANVTWNPSLLRRCAERLRDPEIGLVGAVVRDRNRSHQGIGDQEEAYVGMENLTKYREGVLWGNMMGAFGACYAMKARLFRPVPASHLVDDFYQTMQVIGREKMAVVDLGALCYESVSTEIDEEFRRKSRIATGNFQNLHRYLPLYLPGTGGWANSFAFWSHKGLRWLGPVLLGISGVSLLVLAGSAPFYRWLLAAGVVLLAGCGIDAILARSGSRFQARGLRFVRYFLVMNAALFHGMVRFLRGPKGSVWEPTRRVAAGGRSASRRSSRKESVS